MLVTRSGLKNSVNMLPTRFSVVASPADEAASLSPWQSRAACVSNWSYGFSSRRIESVAMPHAIESGFPESVPAW
jgi:hypothetical protein